MPDPAKSRITYRASYPDPLGRIIATADFGTNGGVALERPDLIPARSATVRVLSTAYDAAGMAVRTTDPAGRVDEKTFDDAGRLIQTVENKKESSSSSSSGLAKDDENRTTDYEYNLDGKMTKLLARNYVTGDQVTEWIYGVNFTATGGLASNALLQAKVYSDADPEDEDDRVTYEYNRLGELTSQKDQAGTNHAFLYDKLGRLLHDCVTLPQGSDIDDTVLRISRAYNARGLPDSISSWDDATPEQGNCLNEVTRTYNDFGQLEEENQAHGGAVNSSSPSVGYSYEQDETTPIPNTTRLRSCTYPNGRQLGIGYGDAEGRDNILSRLSGLVDNDDQELVHYTYLGAGQVVRVEYPEPGVELTYLKQDGEDDGDAGDQYAGLDRFGRIVDQRWLKQPDSSSSSSSAPGEDALERVKFTYDQAGNIVLRHNVVAPSGQDEAYEYDGLYQLTRFQRGTLNSQPSTLDPVAWQEDLTFDPLGNWKRYQTDDSANPLDQSRTHNQANELLTIDESSAHLAHDPAGNMTRCPTPASLAPTGGEGQGQGAVFDLTWDAWNRLVKVEDGETVVAEYAYDGLTRRITKAVGGTTRHYYYNADWQILEERVGSRTDAERQWVWGIQRLDDPVLRDRDTDQDGDIDERLYALSDHLSPRALADAQGIVQERFAYDAFGNARLMDGHWREASSSPSGWELRMHGYHWNSETAIYLVRHRSLHLQLGRWLSRDPVTEAGGLNLYAFVVNNPTQYVDAEAASPNLVNSPASQSDTLRAGSVLLTGPKPKPKPGKPTCISGAKHCPNNPIPSNGCGPQGWKPNPVPNKPFLLVDFKPACTAHDICYGTCGKEKDDCDRAFHEDLLSACYDKWGNDLIDWGLVRLKVGIPIPHIPSKDELMYKACIKFAEIYFKAVSTSGAGDTAYNAGQEAGCKCCCPKKQAK